MAASTAKSATGATDSSTSARASCAARIAARPLPAEGPPPRCRERAWSASQSLRPRRPLRGHQRVHAAAEAAEAPAEGAAESNVVQTFSAPFCVCFATSASIGAAAPRGDEQRSLDRNKHARTRRGERVRRGPTHGCRLRQHAADHLTRTWEGAQWLWRLWKGGRAFVEWEARGQTCTDLPSPTSSQSMPPQVADSGAGKARSDTSPVYACMYSRCPSAERIAIHAGWIVTAGSTASCIAYK